MNAVSQYIRSIFEFADNREQAIKTVRGLSFTFSEHICKIFLWGSQNENWLKDWSDEIWDYLHQISEIKFKSSKKRPKAEFFQEYFFFPYLETADEMNEMLMSVERACQDKDNYPKATIVYAHIAHEKYLKFVVELSTQLQNGTVRYKNVLELCKDLVGE